ncbi:hypothetical protein ACFSKN_08055 [Mariniflexile gromovii]|uniref:Uncharacterized protein n=1 Tax=Mariniflexile gromovii TaxID=362523 RepID=A0ABS4BW12_9FLAO|nr:hypothetical protein [Mariniflexile gromovii]MBP0904196.1 hypothetical protein [Mariniflexile gromovii]
MGSTVFKRLFEIQILHDYFLTAVDGVSFFDNNEVFKKDLLVKKLSNYLYDVNTIFEIEAVGNTKLRLSENKLIFKKTALGFIVGTEVDVVDQAGEIRYKPMYVPKSDTNLTFALKAHIPFFKSITNTSFKPAFPAIFYFTNKGKIEFDETTIPPYKSLPIATPANTHQNGLTYEMGAIVNFGGTIRQALQSTDGSDPTHWEDMDDKRFMTDADRILLPQNFQFVLKKDLNITQLDAVLEDLTSNPIKVINKTSLTPIEHVLFNFTKVDENNPNSADIPSGYYLLKIKLNGGLEVSHSIYLNNDIYSKDYLGIIDIRFDELNSPFSILDATGLLKTKIDVANNKVLHPIFELRLKNRKTYWRYTKNSDFSVSELVATSSHLQAQPQPEVLVSIKPKALTETLVPFQNGTSLILPHPKIASLKVERDKIFSEININQSNRLLSN